MSLWQVIILTFLISATATAAVRRIALRAGVVDRPDGVRKKHGRSVPLMGGVAIFVALAAGIAIAGASGWVTGEFIKEKHLAGILVASFLLVFGGALDDRWNLRPSRQIVWPLLAAFVIIASGIGITYVTNPFGGLLHLDRYAATVLWWQGIPYKATFLADAFTLVWLMSMTYTTKLLDGLDGLVAGIAVIGAVIIAAVSMMREVSQPDTAALALVVAAAFLGFLLFNFHPARIFLGEGGSTLAGFLLGTLAIASGGKIATALLVLGLPLFDAALVVFRRLRHHARPTSGDRSHLHFRLLELGFTHRQAVLFYYMTAAAFGTGTLVLRGWQKVAALGALLALLLAVSFVEARNTANTANTAKRRVI